MEPALYTFAVCTCSLVFAAAVASAQETCVDGTVALENAQGTIELTVRIADTTGERAYGLGKKPDFSADDGMLFVYPEPRTVSGFMTGESPVDLITFNQNGTVLAFAPEYASLVDGGDGMLYALIVNAGRLAELGLDRTARMSGWNCRTPG